MDLTQKEVFEYDWSSSEEFCGTQKCDKHHPGYRKCFFTRLSEESLNLRHSKLNVPHIFHSVTGVRTKNVQGRQITTNQCFFQLTFRRFQLLHSGTRGFDVEKDSKGVHTTTKRNRKILFFVFPKFSLQIVHSKTVPCSESETTPMDCKGTKKVRPEFP